MTTIRITLAEIPEGCDEPEVDIFTDPELIAVSSRFDLLVSERDHLGGITTTDYLSDQWTHIEVTR